MQEDQDYAKRQALQPKLALIAGRKDDQDLGAQLAREGKALRAQLHSQGELLARVTAALDRGLADGPEFEEESPSLGRFLALPAQGVGRQHRLMPASLEALGLLAAALLLLVCLPHFGGLSEPEEHEPAEGTKQVELALLTASRLERLYPAQLLHSLSTPLTRLVQAEGQEVQRDLRHVVEGFSEQLPAFLR